MLPSEKDSVMHRPGSGAITFSYIVSPVDIGVGRHFMLFDELCSNNVELHSELCQAAW